MSANIVRKVAFSRTQFFEVGDYFDCRVALTVIEKDNEETFCTEYILIESTSIETSQTKGHDTKESTYYDLSSALSEFSVRAKGLIVVGYELR